MITFPEQVTIGEKYGPAMKITDPQEAAEYFEACVQHTMTFGTSRKEAESIERQNLGYFSGYYDYETMKRVEVLFLAKHPIFGSADQAYNKSAEELIEDGKKWTAS
jgi:hypothetical protein